MIYRFILTSATSTPNTVVNTENVLAINHLQEFKDYILIHLGASDVVLNELEEVSK